MKWYYRFLLGLTILFFVALGPLTQFGGRETTKTNGSIQTIGYIGTKILRIGPMDVYALGSADYGCDGVDDNVQWQQALNALPANGGKIIVYGFNYHFSNNVTRASSNITIEGVGKATFVSRDGVNPCFIDGGNYWTYRGLAIDAGGVDHGAYTTWTEEGVTIGTTYYAYRTGSSITASSWYIPAGRGATIFVAASNAASSEKAQADVLCDGTADQVEINAARATIGTGLVQLSSGLFNVSGNTSLSSNVTLRGMGDSTVIRLADGSNCSMIASYTYSDALGQGAGDTNIGIENLVLDVNATNQWAFPRPPPYRNLPFPIAMKGVNGLSIQHVRVINGGGSMGACCYINRCTDIYVNDYYAQSSLVEYWDDAMQLVDSKQGTISNLRGHTGDDFLTIASESYDTGEFTISNITAGSNANIVAVGMSNDPGFPIPGVRVYKLVFSNINAVDGSGNIFRIRPVGFGVFMDTIILNGATGRNMSSVGAVQVYWSADPTDCRPSNINLLNISVDNASCPVVFAQYCDNLTLTSITGTNLRADGIELGTSSKDCKNVLVNGYNFSWAAAGAADQAAFKVGTVYGLSVQNGRMLSPYPTYGVYFTTGGTVTSFNIQGNYISSTSPAFYLAGGMSNGIIRNNDIAESANPFIEQVGTASIQSSAIIKGNHGYSAPADVFPEISSILAVSGNTTFLLPSTSINGTAIVDYSRKSNNFTSSKNLQSYTTALSYRGRMPIFQFSGTNEYWYIADDASLATGNGTADRAFSITAVFARVAGAGAIPIVGRLNNGAGLYEFQLWSQVDNTIHFDLIDGSNSANQLNLVTTGTITVGTLYVITATYDGSSSESGLDLYFNGVAAAVTKSTSGGYVAMNHKAVSTSVGADSAGVTAGSCKVGLVHMTMQQQTPDQVYAEYVAIRSLMEQ